MASTNLDGGDSYYEHVARLAAAKYGIDPNYFARQIDVESSFQPDVVSSAGAIGIAQFMPGTAASMNVDPHDPEASLDAAARLMREYLDDNSGDWSAALAAYNAGPAWADNGPMPEETKHYISMILGDSPAQATTISSIHPNATGITFKERPQLKPGGQPMASPTLSKHPLFDTITGIGSALKPKGKAAVAATGIYQPTGDYAADLNGYGEQSDAAWTELNNYIQSSGKAIEVDPNTGIASIVDPSDPKSYSGVDTKATQLAQKAMAADTAIDRLLSRRKAGLGVNGQTAASAYLTSEKDKAAEATRQYDDYVKRIGDLTALEDLPAKRQQTLASTIASINSSNAARTSALAPKSYLRPQAPVTDTAPMATAIRSTIPNQAPQPYNINPSALAPDAGGAVPMKPVDHTAGGMASGPPPQGQPLVSGQYDPSLSGMGYV